MNRLRSPWLALFLLLFSLPGEAQVRRDWFDPALPFRRKIKVEPARPSIKEAWVTVPTLGLARADGRDVVITAGTTQAVPFKVMAAGFDDSVTLAFAMEQDEDRYYAYFGNEDAGGMDAPWAPRSGLLLEVRERGPGSANSLEELFAMLSRSPRVIGRDYRRRPALAFNPFGSQNDYIMKFEGYVFFPETGEYQFGLNSKDASFVLVDQKPVAFWPGRHDQDAFAVEDHSGAIHLPKGLHSLTLFNVAFEGGGCALGIRLPSWEEMRHFPAQLVQPMAKGECLGVETLDRGPMADFIWRREGDLGLEQLEVSRLRFMSTTTLPGIRKITWEFGDGTRGQGREIEHVFLESGLREVTLTLELGEGRSMTAIQKIQVYPGARNLDHDEEDRMQEVRQCLTVCSTYELEAMGVDALSNLVRLTRLSEREDLVFKALEVFFSKEVALDSADRSQEALDYAHYLLEQTDRFEEAANLFLRVWREGTERRHRREAQLAAAEVHLFYTGDTEAAEALLLSMKEKGGGRRLALRFADLRMALGEIAEAREIYEVLQAAPFRSRHDDLALARGDYRISFHSYLEAGQLEWAETALREWELAMPSMKSTGEIPVAWSKLLMGRKQWRPALCQLQWALALDDGGNLAPSVLLEMARCHAFLDNEKEARNLLQRIVKDHSMSPEAALSRERLNR